MRALRTQYERWSPGASFLLLIAFSNNLQDACELPRSMAVRTIRHYLGLDMIEVLLARIKVVLVLSTVEATVAVKDVTKGTALLTTSI